jgi:hypothetical protein
MSPGVDALEQRLLEQAAQVHAAMAVMTETLAEFDSVDGWHGYGIRSIGHWCDINLGFDSRRASRMAFAAGRLAVLPELRRGFAEGALSLEKVLVVAAVATAESDVKFTTIARAASVAQLQRICAAYRDLGDDPSPDKVDERHARRSVTSQQLDSKLVRIVAVLEPDEAAIVLGALDARVENTWRRERDADEDHPPRELSSRRADALVELATEGLVEGPDPVMQGERIQVNVHVDADVLSGARPDGVCCIDGVGAVSPAVVRRLICDADVRVVTKEIDGVYNLGRSQRTPNRRQRRALRHRDGGCRFPGCSMRRFVQAHHAVPWEDFGPTNIDNLMLLCTAHHRLFHEGNYTIDVLGEGNFTFRRPNGRPIQPPPLRAKPGAGPPASDIPRATGGGERFDLGLTIDALRGIREAS